MKVKVIFMAIVMLFINGCSSYTQEGIKNRYLKLSKNLDILMGDEISEKKRASLEKEFEKFSQGMIKYREENNDIDTKYLDYYIKETSIKLQYLKDLKD